MRILTLNCGSSSVKFSVFETSRILIAKREDRNLVRGLVERIGQDPSFLRIRVSGSGEKSGYQRKVIAAADHTAAIRVALEHISESVEGEIEAVGHRVVHGGVKLGRSCFIDDDVEKEIENAIDFAPLHNPHNLSGIRAIKELLPGVPNVATFDTGFHRTIPPHAATYALPRDLVQKHNLHRYGFHGLSHRYLVFRLERLLNRSRDELRLITCHLGNGCSITAVEKGRSLDTSMGFTPCEGLIMGTRPGDTDPGLLLQLMIRENMSVQEMETLINRRSGLLGISGVSNDFREILAARARGNENAALAVDAFCYRLKKYIGGYAAALEHVDAIAFTGGIGEHVPEVRQRALEGARAFGIKIDPAANEEAGSSECKISAEDSAVQVWVIPTDEELVIARDTARCVEDLRMLST
ncbi:MAG: acetate kinase [Candidatus Hydrogenedentota bacterium]|nr:MAG: acetate kinase [Candidatus Hydrogenedentota bacterium]